MSNGHAAWHGTSQFVTLLHVQCRLNPTILQSAFSHICRKDPVFSSALRRINGKWALVRHTSYPSFLITFEESSKPLSPSDHLLENELNSILDSSRELIRLRIISTPDGNEHVWLLTLHHGVADAFTAKRLLSELLYETTLPPLVLYQNKKTTLSLQKEHAAYRYNKHAPGHPDFRSSLEAIAPFGTLPTTQICTLTFGRETVQALTKRAKEQHVSLNSLLTTACSESVLTLLNISNIDTFTAVSTRGTFAPNRNTGCFIDIAPITFSHDDAAHKAHVFNRSLNAYKQTCTQKAFKSSTPALSQTFTPSRKKAINNCQGIGFTHNGCIDKMPIPRGINILAYRSVANRNSGDLLSVFHFYFLYGELFISICSPSLLIEENMFNKLLFITQDCIYTKSLSSQRKFSYA